ncbi:MAG TPA: ABC transporter ATP-binding protein [Candidatus Hydrogenedentes bacterium]|nr:ABC transporter ATP-binding protein [Candidatus Hydrogenedentota bacterium]
MDNLLEIKDLEVKFFLKEGTVHAVNGVSMSIAPHQTLGVVGESGCGKSITALAAMRILPSRGRITSGEVWLAPRSNRPDARPRNLVALPANGRELRSIRGGDLSMIFQEPMTSFSPVHTIGNQIGECVRLHQNANRREARDRVIEMLKVVGVPMPEKRVDAYPHELSGGLRQRCMVAMALSCNPRLLVADEPTTALDVTIQGQILNLIRRLQAEFGMAVMMITHDLGVIAETASEVLVMYLGRVVEQGDVYSIFEDPKHPYTCGLLRSVPRIGKGSIARLASIPGSVPNPFEQLPGCTVHPRCEHCIKGTCDVGPPPPTVEVAPGHRVACHLYANAGLSVGVEP